MMDGVADAASGFSSISVVQYEDYWVASGGSHR